MDKNYDFLNVGPQKTIDAERVLLSASVTHFSESGEKTDLTLLLSKSNLTLEYDDAILRKISLYEIDAITISNASSEFILHVIDDEDERLASYTDRREIIEMILYLLTKRAGSVDELSAKMAMYFVSDINLDLYVTTEEDLEDGHTIRPDEKYLEYMDHRQFLDKQEVIQETKIRTRTNTRTLFTKADKKVSAEDFELLKVLGKGAHGKVLLCEKKTGEKGLYAMKIIKKQHIIDSNQLEHTKAEKMILSYVNHPFLVSLQYAFQTDEKIYFVMEFMKGGELFQHLRRVKQFSEEQAKHITACLVLAIGHLHNKDYIYRDLKPENVLMDHNGYCKLTDFGLAKLLSVSDLAKTFCGTPEYLSPEVILDKGCNRPADWWSLGILVFEMLYGIPPFYSTNVQKMYKNTILNPLKFKKHTECSDEAKDFISGLLVKKPKHRLGSIADSLEIMSHAWFRDFDWSKLLAKKLDMPYKPLPSEDEWEANFDPTFTKQKPSDSNAFIDPNVLVAFKKDFEDFDYEPEEDLGDLEPRLPTSLSEMDPEQKMKLWGELLNGEEEKNDRLGTIDELALDSDIDNTPVKMKATLEDEKMHPKTPVFDCDF